MHTCKWMVLSMWVGGLLLATGVSGCHKKGGGDEKAVESEGAGEANGEPTEAEDPVDAEPLKIEVKPQRLALGAGFTCYLNDAGELWCWGWGDQLPLPGLAEPVPPTKQEIGITLTSIDAFSDRLCGIAEDRSVHCWAPDWSQPKLTTAAMLLNDATSIAVGGSFVCVVTGQNSIDCIGRTQSGVAGRTGSLDTAKRFAATKGSWVRVDAGNTHACGLTDVGEMHCWGSNLYGQVGEAKLDTFEPQSVQMTNVTDIALTGQQTCAIANGQAFCWGLASLQTLGSEHTEPLCGDVDPEPCKRTPTLVPGVADLSRLALSDYSGCGTSGDETYCWGAGRDGQLGIGTNPKSSESTRVEISGVGELRCGHRHCCAVSAENTLLCWGENRNGETHPGGERRILSPTIVEGVPK